MGSSLFDSEGLISLIISTISKKSILWIHSFLWRSLEGLSLPHTQPSASGQFRRKQLDVEIKARRCCSRQTADFLLFPAFSVHLMLQNLMKPWGIHGWIVVWYPFLVAGTVAPPMIDHSEVPMGKRRLFLLFLSGWRRGVNKKRIRFDFQLIPNEG